MAKRIAMILSGCGHRDGTELTEAASCWIALSETGAEVEFFAPNETYPARDPFTGESTFERRNALRESARFARGNVRALTELRADGYDALVLPGGMGMALNLSDWASASYKCTIHADVERAILEFHRAQKPIGAACIASAIVAKVLGSHGVTVSLGRDAEMSVTIARTGALHESCAVDDYVTDRDHRIVSTPAYMYPDAKAHQVFTGIRSAMRELVEMA